MNGFFLCQRIKKVRGDQVGVVGVIAGSRDHLLHVTLLEGGGVTTWGRVVGPGDTVWSPAALWEPSIPPELESREEIEALTEPSPIEEVENAAMRKEWHVFRAIAEAAYLADMGGAW